VEQQSSSGDQLCAAPVCEQAIVANADKRPREDMDEKAPYEIRRLKGQHPTPIAAATVAITESDLAVLETDDATVRDRDSVRVPAEISEYLLRTSHGWFAVNHPLSSRRLAKLTTAGPSAYPERAVFDRGGKAVQKLASEEGRECAYRYKEIRSTSNPPIACWREATAGDDAVDMRVEGQRLRPRVEDGNGAGKHSEMLTTDVMKRFQCSRKEQSKGDTTIGEEEGVERRGHGEDHVKVGHGQ
jgi:hypothetical protein